MPTHIMMHFCYQNFDIIMMHLMQIDNNVITKNVKVAVIKGGLLFYSIIILFS